MTKTTMTADELKSQTKATFAAWLDDPKTPRQWSMTGEGWSETTEHCGWHHNRHYRIKPWTLGREINGHTLPEGKQWHRADGWTPEMLPAPYRPLMAGRDDGRYECTQDGKTWESADNNGLLDEDEEHDGWFYRTRRPIDPVAEGYNGYNFTVSQVGEGLRLVHLDEGTDKPHSLAWWKATQFWSTLDRCWKDTINDEGSTWTTDTLCTRLTRSELAALDAPKPCKHAPSAEAVCTCVKCKVPLIYHSEAPFWRAEKPTASIPSFANIVKANWICEVAK